MYMMKCDNSHSHSHCICNTQNRMLWCCHSLTAAVNSLVSPTATQPHPTVSPYLSQQDSYLVYRRRSSTSPFHLFLLRVNDSRDGPWISSHHPIPHVASQNHPKTMHHPVRFKPRPTPSSHQTTSNIPCSMLLQATSSVPPSTCTRRRARHVH